LQHSLLHRCLSMAWARWEDQWRQEKRRRATETVQNMRLVSIAWKWNFDETCARWSGEQTAETRILRAATHQVWFHTLVYHRRYLAG
jgi:hypothetical protein